MESILTSKNKPEMPTNCQPGVYFVPTGCRKGYTGETKKQILTRNYEHEKAVFNNDQKDAIAEHHNKCGCKIDLAKTKTVAVEPACQPGTGEKYAKHLRFAGSKQAQMKKTGLIETKVIT